jgi:methylthioribulose 1-phosphate dehydratase/enolase-phosphatase E1
MIGHYVERPEDKASATIVSDIGVQVASNTALPPHIYDKVMDNVEYIVDGKEGLYLQVVSSGAVVDVRDSAHAWVRVALSGASFPLTVSLATNTRFRLTSTKESGKGKVQVHYSKSPPKEVDASIVPTSDPTVLYDQDVPCVDPRALMIELCKQFWNLGWVTGTGGSISIKHGNRYYMSPSGVQKERMKTSDMFVLDREGVILSEPKQHFDRPKLTLSQCSPLFLTAFNLRGAGAAIHTHSMDAALLTMMVPGNEVRISHQEMIKGVGGHQYHDTLVIPIIENTPQEIDLAASLAEAIKAYPKSNAVLVRRHGVYVWGASWIKAKAQCESFDFLFKWAVGMLQMGQPLDLNNTVAGSANTLMDVATVSSSANKRKLGDDGVAPAKKAKVEAHSEVCSSCCFQPGHTQKLVLLDIEGTTSSIKFVTETLFPFARKHVAEYLRSHRSDSTIVEVIKQLRDLAAGNEFHNYLTAMPVIGDHLTDGDIDLAVLNVHKLMDKDYKVGPLKTLQGYIWAGGYETGDLVGHVYPDVSKALARWTKRGVKTYIYSSGSRAAQRSIFQNSCEGDLRPYLYGHFDTTSGGKREKKSYGEISLNLGVDPCDVLFGTDILEEAQAAHAAGMNTVILLREGNAPLPQGHSFRTAKSFDELDSILGL